MRAVAVYPGRHDIRIVEHPEPAITGPGQVKIRMLDVGVCGTDKEVVSWQYGSAPPGSDYFVLGHESLGEVVEGDGMERGGLVVSAVRVPCGVPGCLPCRAGRQDFCATGKYSEHGIKDLHGFMTEMVVVERKYLHAVPRELRDVAVLVEPLTIVEKTLLEVRHIQERLPWKPERRRAVVLGAGPVGLLGAMALVNAGYETWVYSRGRAPNAKSAIAEAAGAQYVSTEAEPPERFAARVGGIDLVYEAVGAKQVAFEILRRLGPNGVFVFTGVPGRDELHEEVGLPMEELVMRLVMKNQVVMGTVNAGPDAFEAAVADLGVFSRRWPKAVRSLITGRFRLEDFHDPVFGKAGGIKNVIEVA